MPIIPVEGLPPDGRYSVAEDLTDIVVEAFPLVSQMQTLARHGLLLAVHVAPGNINAYVTVSHEALGLLPVLLHQIDDPTIAPPELGHGRGVAGTMCEGNVTIQITMPEGSPSASELRALLRSRAKAEGRAA